MKKINTVEEAFALEGLDPNNIEIKGIPERHIEALKAIAQLWVVTDHVNEGFQPDYSNRNQWKYENIFLPGSPSGAGFSFHDYAYWHSTSLVGARLVSESGAAARHIAHNFEHLYKAFMVYQRPVKEK